MDCCMVQLRVKTKGYITSPKAPRPITFRISKSSLCRRICFTLEVKGLAADRRKTDVRLIKISQKGCLRDIKQRGQVFFKTMSTEHKRVRVIFTEFTAD